MWVERLNVLGGDVAADGPAAEVAREDEEIAVAAAEILVVAGGEVHGRIDEVIRRRGITAERAERDALEGSKFARIASRRFAMEAVPQRAADEAEVIFPAVIDSEIACAEPITVVAVRAVGVDVEG